MPRYKRLFLPEIPLHIVQRGHNRQPTFSTAADYKYYLANTAEAAAKYAVKVHAYCLMSNHVHLLVSPGPTGDSVSSFMRVIAARQTRRVNKRERRTGTLWESRFKASPIDTAAYLLACFRYIELNPVRAGLVQNPADYPWSSYRHNCGDAFVDWLAPHAEFDSLGADAARRAAAYRVFVAEGVSQEEARSIRTSLRRNQATGNEAFRAFLSATAGRNLSSAGPGRPRK